MYYNNTSHFIFDIASLKVQALHHFLATDLLAHLEYYTLNDYINAMYESGKESESGLLKPTPPLNNQLLQTPTRQPWWHCSTEYEPKLR